CYGPAAEQSCAVRCSPVALACPAHLTCDRGFCRAPGGEACGALDGGMELDTALDAVLDAPVDALQPPNVCPASYVVTASGRRIRRNPTPRMRTASTT
ncbi:MAG: hypothetical protein M3619_03875, partial [Myxococcota bacterium]|nr:hypothetical protein [Myxococcota bacterium]